MYCEEVVLSVLPILLPDSLNINLHKYFQTVLVEEALRSIRNLVDGNKSIPSKVRSLTEILGCLTRSTEHRSYTLIYEGKLERQIDGNIWWRGNNQEQPQVCGGLRVLGKR